MTYKGTISQARDFQTKSAGRPIVISSDVWFYGVNQSGALARAHIYAKLVSPPIFNWGGPDYTQSVPEVRIGPKYPSGNFMLLDILGNSIDIAKRLATPGQDVRIHKLDLAQAEALFNRGQGKIGKNGELAEIVAQIIASCANKVEGIDRVGKF